MGREVKHGGLLSLKFEFPSRSVVSSMIGRLLVFRGGLLGLFLICGATVIVVIALISTTSFVVADSTQSQFGPRATSGEMIDDQQREPRTAPNIAISLRNRVPREVVETYARQIWPNSKNSSSELIHAIHMAHCTFDTSNLNGASEDDLLDALLGLPPFEARCPIYRTHSGIRISSHYGLTRDTESHSNQLTALLVEIGADSKKLIVNGEEFSVRDLITECEASFQLRGEYEWGVIALLKSDPRRRKITNRLGESFSIDQISEALLNRAYGDGSCCGTHVIEALALIESLSTPNGVQLTRTKRTKISHLLDGLQKFLEEQQFSDGSIDPNWGESWRLAYAGNGMSESRSAMSRPTHATLADKMLATSHHIEWLIRRRSANPLSQEFYERANSFLKNGVDALIGEKDASHYCCISHAIRTLFLLNNGTSSSMLDSK